ncbi:MAG TPA: trypsin-like serine protease [Gaiellaceae bacterium]|nr:trypsin-like serine protease [Gaiellaceae bacterium]
MPSSTRTTVAALAAALSLASAAGAVTGSDPDGDAHPYAGAVVVDGSVRCSAVLVAPAVVATAAHCVSDGAVVDVAFDSKLDRASWTLHRGRAVVHPAYNGNGDDLAVVLLDAAAGIAPAALPAAGAVAGLSKGALVVSVGYGYSGRSADGSFLYDGLRRAGSSPVAGITKSALRLDTSEGGPCMGDSGGPQLVGDTVLSVTVSGSKTCDKKAEGLRLDTPSARGFLGRFVALP